MFNGLMKALIPQAQAAMGATGMPTSMPAGGESKLSGGLAGVLNQRAMGAGQQAQKPALPPGLADGMPEQAQGTPTPLAMPVVPPTIPPSLPPRMERFQNGQMLQNAYRNNWEPNPMLMRLLMSRQQQG